MEEGQKNDDRNWHPEQPQQNSTAHDFLLCLVPAYRPVRPGFQLSRTCPPSVAARLAQKAPISSEAVSHRDNLAAAFRALSKAVFACSMTSETRFPASVWPSPVRAETTCAKYARS